METQGWFCQGEFSDEGKSGLIEPPDLQQLPYACRAGHANLVVVTDVSRFSRNLALRVEVIAQLQEMGVGIKVIH